MLSLNIHECGNTDEQGEPAIPVVLLAPYRSPSPQDHEKSLARDLCVQ